MATKGKTTKRVKNVSAAGIAAISPKKLLNSYNRMLKSVTAFGKVINAT